MRFRLFMLLALLVAAPAFPLGLADITNKDAVAGLKQALTDGSAAAIGKLGAENGFFGNAKVKIPLPETLQKVEGLMHAQMVVLQLPPRLSVSRRVSLLSRKGT